MEKLKIKHDHKLTDILKVGIFCLFLILPILLFLPNCLYYGFNEHANAQERIEQEPVYYQTNEINDVNDFNLGFAYKWIDNTSYTSSSSIDVLKINITQDAFNVYFPNFVTQYEDANIYLASYLSGVRLKLVIDNVWVGNYDINNIQFPFVLETILDNSILNDLVSSFESFSYYFKEYQPVAYTMSISDSIYQAWQSTWTTPFLQWTDNNNFQFTVNAFTNVFGITQESYITNYLTYILTITCIYLVFDIVISISTKLTHMLTNSKD